MHEHPLFPQNYRTFFAFLTAILPDRGGPACRQSRRAGDPVD